MPASPDSSRVMIEVWAMLFLVVLFFGMVGLLRLGRRVGSGRAARDPRGWAAGTAPIEGAVFALMTLLVAFTFSGAATRFADRRQLIVEETNAIQTAYLRLDLLPPATRPKMRDDFRRYVDSRIAVYKVLPNIDAARHELARSNTLQLELWRDAIAALDHVQDPRAPLLLLPSLNEMIDLTTARTVALKTHPPAAIFALLGGLALACAFVAGIGMAPSTARNHLHSLGFSALVVLTLAIILDFEFPRVGLIRVDAFDELLINARDGMK